MTWTKQDFLDHVAQNWCLRGYASKVTSWAIGENEAVLEDFLAKRERNGEGFPEEEHYVVTDRRLLHFKLTHREIEYCTVLVSDDVASIAQRFPVPASPEYFRDYKLMRAPDVEVALKNGTSITFEAPPYPDDKERFKKFVLALVSLFPARRA